MVMANRVPLSEWEGGDDIIGANQAGKCACSLFNCISVTDDSEINEQNKSIATGFLYAHSEFDAFSTLVHGEIWISNPLVNDCCIHGTENVCRSQISIVAQRNGVGTSVRNLKGKGSTVAKMCCLVQRAIFMVIKL